MTPQTPTRPAAPPIPEQIPWMENEGWSYAHRVTSETRRVVCTGESVPAAVTLQPMAEKRRCNDCMVYKGRSAL